jgi:CRP-like cAMP-binding protein
VKQLVEDRTPPRFPPPPRPAADCIAVAPPPPPALRERSDQTAGTRQQIAQHAHVFREGDAASRIYRLIQGAIMLYKLLPDGRRQVVEFIHAGGVFGFSPVAVYECSAEALVDSDVAAFGRTEMEQSPVLWRQLAAQVQLQLCAMHEHAVLLGRKSATERVASFLMHYVPGRGGYVCSGPRAGEDCARVRLSMTRQEIADHLGLTIETVSRVLSRLRRRGILTIERLDEVRINDVCRMCRLTGTH